MPHDRCAERCHHYVKQTLNSGTHGRFCRKKGVAFVKVIDVFGYGVDTNQKRFSVFPAVGSTPLQDFAEVNIYDYRVIQL